MTDWLSLCRGRACIACGIDDGTVVPAHANHLGKGVSLKCPDWTVVPLCMTHHAWLDGPAPREEKRMAWQQWWTMYHMALCEAEMVKPAKPEYRIPRFVPRNPDGWGGPEAA